MAVSSSSARIHFQIYNVIIVNAKLMGVSSLRRQRGVYARRACVVANERREILPSTPSRDILCIFFSVSVAALKRGAHRVSARFWLAESVADNV